MENNFIVRVKILLLTGSFPGGLKRYALNSLLEFLFTSHNCTYVCICDYLSSSVSFPIFPW